MKNALSNLAMRVAGKVTPADVQRVVGSLDIEAADNLHVITSEAVNVASVQLLIKRYTSLLEYIEDMNRYIADAVNRRAHLVCFPACAGILPAYLVPQCAGILERLRPRPDTGLPDIPQLYSAFSNYSDYLFDIYFNTMAQLAARHNIYLMAGSTYYFAGNQLQHRAFLFNNKGDLLGYQDKVALSTVEAELGMNPAPEIRLFETPLGLMSILIDNDVRYFETVRIAKGLGAQIILCPASFPGEYSSVTAALGLQTRVQEQSLYGVQSTLVGDTVMGFSLEGGCAVYAPGQSGTYRNGVLSKSAGRFEPDIVTATLNLDKLAEGPGPYLSDRNQALMKSYIDRLF